MILAMGVSKHKRALFVFRRDLRLEDNTGLIAALKNSEHVLPCFILDPRQYRNNEYKSLNCMQFMLESIVDLQQQLKKKGGELFLLEGITEKVIKKFLLDKKIDAVYLNRDYTPFSLQRDEKIATLCKKLSIEFYDFDDALLNSPDISCKEDGTPYQVFTAFYKKCRTIRVSYPQKNHYRNYYVEEKHVSNYDEIFNKILHRHNLHLAERGGRKACLKKIKQLKLISNYLKDHDYPAKNSISVLSPHLKFTTCSVREIYHAIKKNVPNSESLIRQLYWRDFFTCIAFYFPQVFGHSFHKKYDHLRWNNNKKRFRSWCLGKTGVPIVDAGMRQLNLTGFMHNRVRLITASFLIKDLHIDWRWGEKFFAQQLIDYDPAVNNGNWQWVAGTGTDAQPYFRIFNPWLQQQKYDPDCEYIKKWLPELRHLDNRIIHRWYKSVYKTLMVDYPRPLVDHKVEALKALNSYSRVRVGSSSYSSS